MRLYILPASKTERLFGTPGAPRPCDAVVVARKPDDSAFLVLSRSPVDFLDEAVELPVDDYVFTFRQEWGTNLSRDKLTRTIDALRDGKLAAGVEFGGRRYRCDDVLRGQLLGHLSLWQMGALPADASVMVRSIDNVVVPMTRDDVAALLAAMTAYVQQVYAEAWADKDALPRLSEI